MHIYCQLHDDRRRTNVAVQSSTSNSCSTSSSSSSKICCTCMEVCCSTLCRCLGSCSKVVFSSACLRASVPPCRHHARHADDAHEAGAVERRHRHQPHLSLLCDTGALQARPTPVLQLSCLCKQRTLSWCRFAASLRMLARAAAHWVLLPCAPVTKCLVEHSKTPCMAWPYSTHVAHHHSADVDDGLPSCFPRPPPS